MVYVDGACAGDETAGMLWIGDGVETTGMTLAGVKTTAVACIAGT